MQVEHKGTQKIYTDRLLLRKFNENDAKEIFETWISDPEVSKYMVWNNQENIEETEKWLQKIISKYEQLDSYNWGIELKESKKIIGSDIRTLFKKECYKHITCL